MKPLNHRRLIISEENAVYRTFANEWQSTGTGVENTKRYTKDAIHQKTSISRSSETVSETHDVLVFLFLEIFV